MSLHLPKHNWGTRGVDSYEKLERIGAGTYGCVFVLRRSERASANDTQDLQKTRELTRLSMSYSCRQVYMAKDKKTDEIVAIKKIRSLNEVQGVGLLPLQCLSCCEQ